MSDTIVIPSNPAASAVAREEASRPPLKFGQLWDMNFGFAGIQFGWGLQMANMSAIYLKLGAHADNLPLLALAGPVTGFLVQPIIGVMSDRTWSARFGRRRPYFTAGAILASVVLFFMPTSPALWVAATLLWLLDASINVSMEPFRAFVADKLPLSQRATGFLMQSFFIGIGQCLAAILPYVLRQVGVAGRALNGVPLAVTDSFRIGALAFIVCVLWTVLRTPETPPADMAAFERHRRETGGLLRGTREIVEAFRKMPLTMRQLFGVQFFTWFGLSCYFTYFTPALARVAFHTGDPKSLAYDSATEWAGLVAGISSAVTFVAALVLPYATARLGRPRFHAVALAVGGLALISIAFIHSQYLIIAPLAVYGITWASILALPYAILSVALPPERVGVYMGLFNGFIVIAQFIYDVTFKPIFDHALHQSVVGALVFGGASIVIGGLVALSVKEVLPRSATDPAVEADGRSEALSETVFPTGA